MLPTTNYITPDGQDALQPAQPYATTTITQFLNEGTTTTTPTTTTTTTTSQTTTTPQNTTSTTLSQSAIPNTVYAENETEPWNPTPC